MEFGEEYDQVLQKEKRYQQNMKNFKFRFNNDKKFKYIVIGVGVLLFIILLFIILQIVFYKEPEVVEDKFNYIYKTPQALDESFETENYISIYNAAKNERTKISDIILDYYDVAVYNTSLKNNRNTTVKDYLNFYTPSYSAPLNSIFVNSSNTRINSTSNNKNNCIIDSSTESCYTDFKKYIFDKFITLSNKEIIFNDINNYQSIIYSSYFTATNKSTSDYKIPIKSIRKFSSNNMLAYYLDYRKISIDDEININAELKFHEDIIRHFFKAFDNIESKTIKKVVGTSVKSNMNMGNFLNDKYIKYINLKPKVKNGILAYIDIQIDFVPRDLEEEYSGMVRGSESWDNSGIVTSNMTFEDLWEALFGGVEYGFMPYQVDLIDNTLLDYTKILRNQEIFYNPVADMNPAYLVEETYMFDNPVILYNNITKFTITNNLDQINKMAKNIFTAYEKRAQDIFASEILKGGSITYNWSYIYNDSLSKLTIDSGLDVKGFAVGVQVTILALNSNGQEIGTFVIPADEIVISREKVTLK